MRPFVFLIAMAFLSAGNAAFAHFKLNQNVRVHHVVHTDEGLDVFLRLPMSYVAAELVGPEGPDGQPAPAPYTHNQIENGVLMHYVDQAAVQNDPNGLAALAEGTLTLTVDGQARAASILTLRLHPLGSEPGFATLAEAQSALGNGDVFAAADETYVGDVMVDLHLRYSTGPVSTYSLAYTSNPGLPGQEDTANLILDYDGDQTRTYRATGLMHDPVVVSGSAAAAASTFLVEGTRHILEGPDHVLFVLCMIIGAMNLHSLLARVTGFTLGHTVTLILGFFGIAPSGAWFIPTVELLIALSIIYAAVMAVRPPEQGHGDLRAFAITSGIGLLHGFGFSFMLHQILRVDAPNVWHSLLAFNVGVEVGQLLIVLLVWPLVLFLRKQPGPIWTGSRAVVATVASLIAMIWVVERAEFFL
ncbi:HupE/UreJ family protein [Ruegeria sp. Ofav3-42]|uniref:HupE/UreJ family protein n=1 Tax=Ruegeria sp. Ofav3-42 TaxID=2917759 RepID=UPI001EF42A1E|nr:HupE/UreJ family protein [Ruegeria sp. Ofav3-42]MCG7521529.1 HupE/UreJ family protein [Ruegeria sp. Ofav3-42]